MKKLYNLQIIDELVVATPLTAIRLLMRDFIANFVRILGICKDFAGNRVNEHGRVPGCGVVPKFSDLEVVALGITAEAFGFDSENLLFHRLHNECKEDFPNLISRRQFNARRKFTARLAEEIRKNVAGVILLKTILRSFHPHGRQIAAMTFMQYVKFVNHRPIGQIKYSLI